MAAERFSCRDESVEGFLKTKALEFDRRNVARTYLLLDGDSFERDEFIVSAYFSLANKPLIFGESLSKRAIKEIDGFSKEAVSVGAILIGQLGKDKAFGNAIAGAELINIIMGIAGDVADMVGGRVIFLECQNETKLVSFYERNGFSYLQSNIKTGLSQFVRRL